VIYLDSSDSGDGFTYQIYVMPDGGKQSSYRIYDDEYDTYNVWMDYTDETHAYDSDVKLSLQSPGNGSLIVKSDWDSEMYLQYGAPDGVYNLVRELK